VLFVDNPIGVGYSASANDSSLVSTIEQLSQDFNVFLQKFFASEDGKKYVDRKFYISGGSYAGKYIPQIAIDYFNSLQRPKLEG